MRVATSVLLDMTSSAGVDDWQIDGGLRGFISLLLGISRETGAILHLFLWGSGGGEPEVSSTPTSSCSKRGVFCSHENIGASCILSKAGVLLNGGSAARISLSIVLPT